MNRGLSGNRFRFVYGGVAVLPKVRILPTNTPEGQAVANHVRLNPQSTTLSGAQLASQKQAASTMPTSQAATNPQQRARFFQAEEAKRRGKSGTTTADTRGNSTAQRAPAGAAAAGGAGGNGGGDGPRGPANDHRYHQKPSKLEAFPDAKRVDGKTPKQGGNGIRPRWKDSAGYIYEWDSRHGTVEKYTKQGKHIGEFCPNTGKQLKPADPGRNIKKYI
ncbi:MAG: hypothetical protein KDH94_02990 [Coxiellaceae bacterium]|nr:hypothetical protein [Coxiellaceae bacterium]